MATSLAGFRSMRSASCLAAFPCSYHHSSQLELHAPHGSLAVVPSAHWETRCGQQRGGVSAPDVETNAHVLTDC